MIDKYSTCVQAERRDIRRLPTMSPAAMKDFAICDRVTCAYVIVVLMPEGIKKRKTTRVPFRVPDPWTFPRVKGTVIKLQKALSFPARFVRPSDHTHRERANSIFFIT